MKNKVFHFLTLILRADADDTDKSSSKLAISCSHSIIISFLIIQHFRPDKCTFFYEKYFLLGNVLYVYRIEMTSLTPMI